MDPVSALGLAANVFQLVDFTTKLIARGSEYHHRHKDGGSLQLAELNTAAENLAALTRTLDLSKLHSLDFEDATHSSDRDIILSGLLKTSDQCRRLAQELSGALEGLTVPAGGWKSFRQALSSLWSEEKINKLSARLADAREQLVVYLLVNLNYSSTLNRNFSLSNGNAVQQNILRAIENSQTSLHKSVAELAARFNTAFIAQEKGITTRWPKQIQAEVGVISHELEGAFRDLQLKSTQDRLLDSLYFTRIEERRERISEAHKNTFNWIFGDAKEDGTQWDSFKCWLQGQNSTSSKIFWITGKAGSGKSTLMRFLDDHPSTRTILHEWAGQHRLLILRCFFWKAGTTLQKSFAGLLRTLLHQLLSLERDLIPSVDPWRWRMLDLGAKQLDDWTNMELESALDTALRTACSQNRVALFIDGLDEFEGTEDQLQNLTNTLLKISLHFEVKICTSSRPWNIFEDAFTSHPSLRLESLTQNDINVFVQNELESNSLFKKHRDADSASCMMLVEEITDKANGVFLWVILVVRDVLKGLRNGQDIRMLRKYIHRIPGDLDQFFLSMLESIEEENRATASKIFQIVINASRPIALMDLSFCGEESVDFAFQDIFPLNPRLVEISLRNETMARRLNAFCMGLLELKKITLFKLNEKTGQLESFSNYIWEIEYLHRSVYDFLLTRESLQTLHIYTNGSFDFRTYLSNAYAAQIILVTRIIENEEAPDHVLGPSSKVQVFAKLLHDFMSSIQEIECSFGKSPISFIEKMQTVIVEHITHMTQRQNIFYETRASQTMENWNHWQCDFLTLAVQYDLELYLAHALQHTSLLPDPDARPLLDVAIQPSYGHAPEHEPNPAIVRLLLSKGASPIELLEWNPAREDYWTKFNSEKRYLHDAKFAETPFCQCWKMIDARLVSLQRFQQSTIDKPLPSRPVTTAIPVENPSSGRRSRLRRRFSTLFG